MPNLFLSEQFQKDVATLRRTDVKLTAKLWDIILNIHETPFQGLGKPEPLKGNLSGFWSRRINGEHRLIYKFENDLITLISCFGHYE